MAGVPCPANATKSIQNALRTQNAIAPLNIDRRKPLAHKRLLFVLRGSMLSGSGSYHKILQTAQFARLGCFQNQLMFVSDLIQK